MIKMNLLNDVNQCNYKGYMTSLNYKTENLKYLEISKIYKKVLKHFMILKWYTDEELFKFINKNLDDKYFLSKYEKEDQVNVMVQLSKRFLDFYLDNKLNFKKGTVEELVDDIKVKCDCILEKDGKIKIIKFKSSKPDLSYKARNPDNLPENNIDLYMLYKLGKQLYPGFEIEAEYLYLKGKNDSGEVYDSLINGNKSAILDTLDSLIIEYKTYLVVGNKKIETQIKKIKSILYYGEDKIIRVDKNNIQDLSDKIEELKNIKLTSMSEKHKSHKCDICPYKSLCEFKVTPSNKLKLLEKTQEKAPGKLKLTDEQKAIVYNTKQGIFRVNATAGSGKTTVMAIRLCELIKSGVDPKEILMITFTEKGAEEMKDKVLYWANRLGVKVQKWQLNIYTFNSFGNKIISDNYKVLGFTEKPQLITNIEQYKIIKELLDSHSKVDWLNYKDPMANFPNYKGSLVEFLNMVDEQLTFDDIKFKDENRKKAAEFASLSLHFQDEIYDRNKIKYQDQILYTKDLYECNTVRYKDKLIPQFRHIIVDEFQDTNKMQMELLKAIYEYSSFTFDSLMVVGDIDQAIYGFQNATPDNMLHLQDWFEDEKVIDLPMMYNFRSTKNICDFANRYIKLNQNRLDFNIKTFNNNGENITLMFSDDKELENKNILNKIKTLSNLEVEYNNMCYISRTGKDLLQMKEYLEKNNIPCKLDTNEYYLDNSYVQSIIALAKYFKNTDYDFYLYNFLMACKKQDLFNEIDEDISEILKNNDTDLDEKLIDKDQRETIKQNTFNMVLNMIKGMDRVCDYFLEELKNKQFHCLNEELDYLIDFELYKDKAAAPKDENKYNAITLTTAHSSKGKEWNIVFSCMDDYSANDESKVEEERRLVFVSFTRAKKMLYVTWNNRMDKKVGKAKVNRFIEEIKQMYF